MRLLSTVATIVVVLMVPQLALAERVNVKYRGAVDLETFTCTEVSRSSFIRRVCYDEHDQYMLLSLNDIYYHYCEIDAQTVSSLMNAPSMGRFYNEKIKGNFDCRTHTTPDLASAPPENISEPPAGRTPQQPQLSPEPSSPPQPPQKQENGGQQQVQMIYSPWTRFCRNTDAKMICFTGKDARVESGKPVVAVVLIEPEGETKKILRVTLPLGMQLVHGTRVLIDQNQPLTAPYVICFTNGCMADYVATPDMIAKMKKGQNLVVQAINSTAKPISLDFSLVGFANAYEGPSDDLATPALRQPLLQGSNRANEERVRVAQASGRFDGRWSATVRPQGACNFTSILILDVLGATIVGNASNPSGVFPLAGTVDPSGRGTFKIGTFAGTVTFSENTFTANYANQCGGRFAVGTKRTGN